MLGVFPKIRITFSKIPLLLGNIIMIQKNDIQHAIILTIFPQTNFNKKSTGKQYLQSSCEIVLD